MHISRTAEAIQGNSASIKPNKQEKKRNSSRVKGRNNKHGDVGFCSNCDWKLLEGIEMTGDNQLASYKNVLTGQEEDSWKAFAIT